MALTNEFRQAVGPGVPISFSAGIDQKNFPLAVACGFVPVTTCTDLLRPGGYGRLPAYLHRLADEMNGLGATSIEEFILKRFGNDNEAKTLAAQSSDASAVDCAAVLNTRDAAQLAKDDRRYHAQANGSTPKRIDSHLEIFDCITCDKCLPVCPNAANFLYPTPVDSFDYHDYEYNDGAWTACDEKKHFEITRNKQIACYADFCNECGNCDTFCPEYGGPYIEKPSFFASRESWEHAKPRDGFFVSIGSDGQSITGRIKGTVFELTRPSQSDADYQFHDGTVRVTICDLAERAPSDDVIDRNISRDDPYKLDRKTIGDESFQISNFKFEITVDRHRIDMGTFHTLRFLLNGILDQSTIHQVNAKTFRSTAR
jgi:putative selenate reductase